mmetsp:Transcript_78571/g.238366  ORF Transcript_78571/g.238366 Transcript_78571/m.238366 type:complete len:654 (-) Transcript_78571:103-2064(-)
MRTLQRLAHKVRMQLSRAHYRKSKAGSQSLGLASRSHNTLESGASGGKEEQSAGRAALALARTFFLGEDTRQRAMALFVTLVLLLLVENAIIIHYSSVQKAYMTALQEKREDGFYHGLRRTALLIVGISPVIALHEYTAGVLKMEWRGALTRRLAQAYLAGAGQSVFYRLHLTGEIDNPDQRICQDAADFVEITFSLVQDSIGTVFGVVGFAGVLYAISPAVCLSVVAYALIGTLVTTLGFGPWIMLYQNELIRQEAGLRYNLIRVREHAESIAFFRGGDAEHAHFIRQFAALLRAKYRSIIVHTSFSVFNRSFHWATFAVAPLMVGPAYLRGEVEFGAISQAGMAFGTILGGLTLVMNKMETLSNFAVRVRRLQALDEGLAREQARTKASQLSSFAGASCIASVELPTGGPAVLQLRGVTLRTPPRAMAVQQTLAEGLSLQLLGGQSLLISGDSGIGKSSLLRAIGGLWNDGAGRVELCSSSAVFFMPQKPYMSMGTLREQLLYPSVDRPTMGNSMLEDALKEVGLGYLLDHHSLWDAKEWSNMLSLGEQQRINFARVLLQPGLRLALIDEGTSACDPANEARLYGLLRQKLHSYVSVGHRPALRQHHSHALWLRRPQAVQPQAAAQGPASFTMMPMADFQRAVAATEAQGG